MKWRDDVDPIIRNHLEMQIKESSKQEMAYSKAKDKAVAQLWCAIANLSKHLFELNLKINYIEKLLKNLKPVKQTKLNKKGQEAIKKVMGKY